MPIDLTGLHYYDPTWIHRTNETVRAEICVYGGNASGVIAAVKAARLGKSVILLQPGKHLGGLTTGGLGWTDYGKKHVIGGMARQFYRDLGRETGKEEEWAFWPSTAERVINRYVAEAKVPVRFCQYLDKVEMSGKRITAITLLGGLRVEAAMFIDASYEGDLMAKTGVTYTVGREGNAKYGETINGIQIHSKHQFSHPVDPYLDGKLLPGIVAEDLSRRQGEGDQRVQAYNFRMCMTDDPALKIAWPKPVDFDPLHYVLATRWFNGAKDDYNEQIRAGRETVPEKFDILETKTPGGFFKTDTNNHGPVSSDFIGANHDWPQADYATREIIFQRHVNYQMGYYWHMANAPEIPERYRQAYRRWGLPKDEFTDTGHWPHQLYIREARRMVSDYVLTEADCLLKRIVDDSVGMGSYQMDSHNCARFVKIENGKARVVNEGDVQQLPAGPYPVSYRSITPKRGECENLLVPVCLSASHICYGSVRMEPVFMVLGESTAEAAVLALSAQCAVQEVDYRSLRERLVAAGQVLTITGP
ncbi:MAG: hypothetical protein PCFJNLEI_03289 [Verrucomicrobiae bacterium]|nr:hypothetical protein [Verrucomicrobiae bacterium]